jgi:hypothetical protein
MGVVYRIKLRQTDLEEQDAMRDTAEQGEDMLEWDDDGQ